MKVCVIGLGYIGLPTAAMFADAGHEVLGVDKKKDIVDALNEGRVLIEEDGLADFIDIQPFLNEKEAADLTRAIQGFGVRVVASFHDFQRTPLPGELLERFKALDRTGADILKAAVMAKDFQDTVRLMQITDKVRREITFRPLIAIAMGKAGAVSRIAGESFGSCVTFAQMAEASAPGQISVHELLPMLKTLHGH